MKRKRPEQDLQVQVMRYLGFACPDAFAFSIPNGGYRRKAEAAIFKGLGVKAGVADICVLWPHGRVGFIELKAPKQAKALSPHQVAFGARMVELGVPFAVCTSLDELKAIIRSWGIPSRDVFR